MSPTPHRSNVHGAEVDLDEDLFDFAAVVRGSAVPGESGAEDDLEEVLASFQGGEASAELARAAAAPDSVPAPVPSPAPREEPGTARSERPLPPLPRRARSSAPDEAPRSGTAPRKGLSTGVLAIALAVTVLNAGLAVVLMRTAAGGNASDPLPAAAVPHLPLADPPVAGASPAANDPSLDEAWAEVARGEYAAARQRAYGVLALLDGVEGARRDALEADCQLVLAQSLHLEALARRGVAR